MTRKRHPRISRGRDGAWVGGTSLKTSIYRVGALPGDLFHPFWGMFRQFSSNSFCYDLGI
jgi:hypothetical protein